MSFDMEQFHQVFFEECFEGLDVMESGLLALDLGDVDSEVINTIFRAAHSIKGGSGTFGFDNVAAYTHVMETLLDEMRDGRRQVTSSAVNVLLGSVDCLREMITAIQDKEIVDEARVAEHQHALENELAGITEEVIVSSEVIEIKEPLSGETLGASFDMSQFHQVFFEECFEGLDVMESGLLALDLGDVDSESINTIFRAAHSIKGGSGTFGFDDIASYTHIMETLLDEMRDGRRQVTSSVVEVLLGSVDCLQSMVTAQQNNESYDKDHIATYKKALESELAGNENSLVMESSVNSCSDVQVWDISFVPHRDLLVTGNDPVRMFRELKELGELKVVVVLDNVPKNYDTPVEECYLAWNLTLTGVISKADIIDVFVWVEDECDLSVILRNPVPLVETAEEVTRVSLTDSVKPVIDVPNLSVEPAIKSMANEAETNSIMNRVQEIIEPTKENNPVVNNKEKSPNKKSTKESKSSIRVDIEKIDILINMVGELVITQSMLGLVGENFTKDKVDILQHGLVQLEKHTRDLQESVMNIRMLPISFVFSRFPRLVHDLSIKLSKKIELKLVGEHTEVDKTVIELISDPLVHLVRNSLDHGIESPEERLKAGKPEVGVVTLEAFHRSGNIVIEVKDDGKGLNKEVLRNKAIEKGLISEDTLLTEKQIHNLIFMAGFSTAEALTDISGRGVGMDVVRRNIQSLGGSIEITSVLGVGSTMTINLPLTLAILDGQSIAVGDEVYILPLASIIESINMTAEDIHYISGKGEAFVLRGEYLSIIRLHEVFNVKSSKSENLIDGKVVVVDAQGIRCGLFVDDLLGQQQVVIKSLNKNYRNVVGISSATILGNGLVALILDIPGLIKLSNQ